MPTISPEHRIIEIIRLLRVHTQMMQPPMTWSIIQQFGKDPFLILISCLLSLRARDSMTLPVSLTLFQHVKTPQELLRLPREKLEKILYPLGFYRKKATVLYEVSQELLDRFQGTVPSAKENLLGIKGIGIKTAALVLTEAFDIPDICVDVHVHRISNRLGIVATKTPEQTQKELKRIIPQEYWREYNGLLVMWGQNICVPVSPFCSRCVLNPLCPKVGVISRR